ncbi:deoxyribonuclease IV [bacterium]|nr:deoxyribonuclease IV [bacterium]MBU4362126.1 deoxyribonuclease IV [bacterium]MBU4602356.1 deoxyribonuclease IV [bacterium]MCG2762698.1 deoxyribonuclease IV [Candidatus Atribacteria bacterium]
MKIGCHISIAGGIDNSVVRAVELDCNTMQIFSKNASTWREKILKKDEVENFRENLKKSNINPVFIHASYLVNLASPSDELYFKSINAFLEDIKRADLLLADPYLIIHPGAHTGAGEEYGIQRIIRALNIILEKSVGLGLKTMILLENTAGSGTHLGYTFGQLTRMMEGAKDKKRIGVCFDTCHAFAAGYDLSHQEGIEQTLGEIDKYLGLERLKVIHLNDSKFPLGSRKDRHMHIGKGYIGLESFKALVNHKYLKDLPFVLETPKHDEKDDLNNINLVKSLVSN